MTAQAYALRITVRLSSGVNDPQGNTVRDGLRSLGYADVRDVRVGKVIDLVVDAENADEAQERGQRMCQELLANPVIETFDIDVMEASKV
jgi:phosphoribosylformylglycinamidine synthase PurS subunit